MLLDINIELFTPPTMDQDEAYASWMSDRKLSLHFWLEITYYTAKKRDWWKSYIENSLFNVFEYKKVKNWKSKWCFSVIINEVLCFRIVYENHFVCWKKNMYRHVKMWGGRAVVFMLLSNSVND